MSIGEKKEQVIHIGCLLCQAIENFELFTSNHIQYKQLFTESSFKKMISFKERWKEMLSNKSIE